MKLRSFSFLDILNDKYIKFVLKMSFFFVLFLLIIFAISFIFTVLTSINGFSYYLENLQVFFALSTAVIVASAFWLILTLFFSILYIFVKTIALYKTFDKKSIVFIQKDNLEVSANEKLTINYADIQKIELKINFNCLSKYKIEIEKFKTISKIFCQDNYQEFEFDFYTLKSLILYLEKFKKHSVNIEYNFINQSAKNEIFEVYSFELKNYFQNCKTKLQIKNEFSKKFYFYPLLIYILFLLLLNPICKVKKNIEFFKIIFPINAYLEPNCSDKNTDICLDKLYNKVISLYPDDYTPYFSFGDYYLAKINTKDNINSKLKEKYAAKSYELYTKGLKISDKTVYRTYYLFEPFDSFDALLINYNNQPRFENKEFRLYCALTLLLLYDENPDSAIKFAEEIIKDKRYIDFQTYHLKAQAEYKKGDFKSAYRDFYIGLDLHNKSHKNNKKKYASKQEFEKFEALKSKYGN